jgi:hypothetical protein
MIYVQNWRVRELLNILSQYKNQLTNRPHVISNQTNHLGENLGHLKDLEISKYKREWKGCMAIKFIVLFLLIVVVFGFLNIKCVTIYSSVPNFHLNGLSDLKLHEVGSLVGFCIARVYLKVHVLVNSEHKSYKIWNTCIVHCIYWSITYLNKLLIFLKIKLSMKSHVYILITESKKYDFFGVKSWFFTRNTPKFSRLPPQLEKIRFFGVKSWFFTRNTPKKN